MLQYLVPPASSRSMGGAICPRDPTVFAPWPELCLPSVSLASISHWGRSDPDGKEPPGQRRVPSPGQSALCLTQGETGWSSHLAQAGTGVRLASWPPGCWAGAFATWSSDRTSAGYRFWLSLTSMHSRPSQALHSWSVWFRASLFSPKSSTLPIPCLCYILTSPCL